MGCMASVPQDPLLHQAIRSKTKHPVNGATHYPRFARPSSYRLSDPDGNDPTSAELDDKRREFWDTQPSYGGSAEIWAALKMAAETMLRPHGDLALCYAVIESADVIVAKPDMTVCYDTMGAKYDIPKWVLRDPSNVCFKPNPPEERRTAGPRAGGCVEPGARSCAAGVRGGCRRRRGKRRGEQRAIGRVGPRRGRR